MKYFAKTIQRKLLLILLAVGLIPAVAGALYIYGGIVFAVDRTLGTFLQERAELVSAALDHSLARTYATATAILRQTRKSGSLAGLTPDQESQFECIVIVDESGNTIEAHGKTCTARLPPRAVIRGKILDSVFIDETSDPRGDSKVVFSAPVGRNRFLLCCAASHAMLLEAAPGHSHGQATVEVASNRGHFIGQPSPSPKLLEMAEARRTVASRELDGWVDPGPKTRDRTLDGFATSRFLKQKQLEGLTSVQWTTFVEMPINDILQLLGFLMWRVLGFGITLTAVLVILSVLITRIFLRPIRQLHSQVSQISSGNLDSRVNIHTHDEIEDLADAFNAMTLRISNFAGELERTVDERTRELQQAHEQLVQSERYAATGRLAGNFAHEINNPLGIIKNYLRILRDKTPSPNHPQEEALTIVQEELDRIARIVRNLLDFYRPARARVVPLNINTEIEALASLIGFQLRRKEVELWLELSPNLPSVPLPPDHIRQILLNLLKNAEDSITGKGRISISTSTAEFFSTSELVVVITDTGCGIPENDLSRVFEPFFSTKREGQGTGLGLSVTYGLVRNLGGTIQISSVVDQGTVVTLRIPVSAPDTDTETPPIASATEQPH